MLGGGKKTKPIVLLAVAVSILLLVAVAFLLQAHPPNSGPTTSLNYSRGLFVYLDSTPRLLGPGTTMNYSVILSPAGDVAGTVVLSAYLEEKNLSVKFEPSSVELNKSDVSTRMFVKASGTIRPGVYPVTILANWARGSYNITFSFTVVSHLVLLLGGSESAGGFLPQNLTIVAGTSVTWLSLDAGSPESGGQPSVAILELNTRSPILNLHDTWQYTFKTSGTYYISDLLNSVVVSTGIITVV